MTSKQRNTLLATGSILVIAVCAVWIYYREFKALKHNVALHRRVGEVMAEQTSKMIGNKGRIVLVTIPTGPEPELQTQLVAFRETLKRLGDYDIKDHELDTKDQPKYGVGSGLSGRRFVRAVKNNRKADVIVSFVGAPKLSEEELAELTTHPKFIAQSRSTDNLPKLFEKQIIQVAVVSRFAFPAPGPREPKTPQQWFDKRYQIVASDAVRSLPPPE
jgi:hypothetical protein